MDNNELNINSLPEKWELKIVEDTVDVIRGISWKNEEVTKSGVAVLTIPNIQDGKISYDTNIHLTKDIGEEKKLKAGDTIAVASSGSIKNIGRSALFTGVENSNLSVASFLLILITKLTVYKLH